MIKLLLPFIFISAYCRSQITFNNQNIELGAITEAYEIKGDVIVKNESAKKIFLMRADADVGVKVYTSKKALNPNDTCLIVISFIPEAGGKFKKKINLVATDKATPYELNLSGNLSKFKRDDKTACFYFGNKKNTPIPTKEEVLIVSKEPEKKDNSNKIPDNSREDPIVSNTPIKKPETPIENNSNELSVVNYKPNNILFLLDVSGSMKDSLKLPLMKSAMHTLIDAVRDIDKITFVTYADSVKIIKENISGADKTNLHNIVNGLRAKGLTKGNKAILFSQQLAQKHFIVEGNNQILLATDGKFKFYVDDVNTWKEQQANGKIIMSTVAFGNDRDAMRNLKEIAEKGEGSFIHIKKRNGSNEKLLEEIKERSKR